MVFSENESQLGSGGEEVVRLLDTATEDGDGIQSFDIEDASERNTVTKGRALKLYMSHMLSTWNARTYEFAAILFTAATFPDTLVASAIRGIVTTIASICVSSAIGRWIDCAPNRLKTLWITIATNRLSVIVACGCWFFIVGSDTGSLKERMFSAANGLEQEKLSQPRSLKVCLFAVVIFLGIFEKLSAAANTMSMERDWVVTIAAAKGQVYDLSHLNAVMRRIDVTCKLVAPIFISTVVSVTTSVRIGVLVVGCMSILSWGVEWWCAKRVWDDIPSLRIAKVLSSETAVMEETSAGDQTFEAPVPLRSHGFKQARSLADNYVKDFKYYFSAIVWVPSMALCLLHLTVLSYSATFITYLLSVGFSLSVITIARTIGSIAELSSTVVTPFGIEYLGKAHHHRGLHIHAIEQTDGLIEDSITQGTTETGLERLGLWGIMWQLMNLVRFPLGFLQCQLTRQIPVVFCLWILSPATQPANFTTLSPPPLLALALFTFLSMSRLGLWIFDLTTQQLTQTLVEQSHRSSFAGVETSFASMFELGTYAASIIFSQPNEFKYLATGSIGAVGLSTVIYAGWVFKMRGHLVHWEQVRKGCDCAYGRRQGNWRKLVERLSLQ